MDLDEFQYADVEVVGIVSDYHLVLDAHACERHKSLVAKKPELGKAAKKPPALFPISCDFTSKSMTFYSAKQAICLR